MASKSASTTPILTQSTLYHSIPLNSLFHFITFAQRYQSSTMVSHFHFLKPSRTILSTDDPRALQQLKTLIYTTALRTNISPVDFMLLHHHLSSQSQHLVPAYIASPTQLVTSPEPESEPAPFPLRPIGQTRWRIHGRAARGLQELVVAVRRC